MCGALPSVTLDSISFKEEEQSALSLRNIDNETRKTEWCNLMDSSPVAYVINKIENNTIKIRVRFKIERDVDMQIQAVATFGSLLGSIEPFTVSFKAKSGSATVSAPFNGSSIGVYTASWDWQYKDRSGKWEKINTTSNTVYLVLNTPIGPWRQGVANNTYQEALAIACSWCQGISQSKDIIPAITQKLYESTKFKYDGKLHYARPLNAPERMSFDIKTFLVDYNNLLNTHPGIQCSDCAVIVATFSRLLGTSCNTFIFYSSEKGSVETTYIKGIGLDVWSKNKWSFHLVATVKDNIKNNINETNSLLIYDGCVMFNGDVDPWPQKKPNPVQTIIPGSPNHEMYYTTQTNDSKLAIPYNDINSYRERLFINDIDAKKNIKTIIIPKIEFTELSNTSSIKSDILSYNYNSQLWSDSDNQSIQDKNISRNFTLSSEYTNGYRRIHRSFISPKIKGERYGLSDIYTNRNNTNEIEIHTHSYESIKLAREVFPLYLSGAKRLLSRDDGVLNVGDLSFGDSNHICFIRNNIIVRIWYRESSSIKQLYTFIQQIDNQIKESSMKQ